MIRTSRTWCCLCLLIGSSVASAQDQVEAFVVQQPNSPQQITIIAQPQSGEAVNLSRVMNGLEFADLGKYWVGVSAAETSEALREHLDFQHGILVSDVVDHGPAQAAGIQKHDILLKAGDTVLKNAKDLIDAVNKAMTNDLSIELIRKGKKQTLVVKPAERPVDQKQTLTARVPSGVGFRNLGILPDGRAQFVLVQPGVPVPVVGTNAAVYSLPAGVSVTTSRTNNDPMKIKVTRGNDSWDITDKELEKLPAELRPHVEQMLRVPVQPLGVPVFHSPFTGRGQPNGGGASAVIVHSNNLHSGEHNARTQDDVVRKSDLKALEDQLKELVKKLEELKAPAK